MKALRILGEGEVLAPAEPAVRAGVATTTVRRLLAERAFIRRPTGQKSALGRKKSEESV